MVKGAGLARAGTFCLFVCLFVVVCFVVVVFVVVVLFCFFVSSLVLHVQA